MGDAGFHIREFQAHAPKEDNPKSPAVSIYIHVVAREGRKATPLFNTDEYLQTSDHKRALIRYSIVSDSQVFHPTAVRTNPRAVGYGADAYIEEGDRFAVIVLSSDYDHLDGAKKVFKKVVRSYCGVT